MTRNQFEQIARIISRMPPKLRGDVAVYFARELAKIYPRFKPHIFIEACKLHGEFADIVAKKRANNN